MDYRKLPHGTEEISTIGLGMGNIYLSPDDEVERILFYAVDHGINLYDMPSLSMTQMPQNGTIRSWKRPPRHPLWAAVSTATIAPPAPRGSTSGWPNYFGESLL